MTSPYEDGDPQCSMMVVGEAPGRVEMRLGRPLVGPSGDVFTDCLHAEGIARRGLYIVNTWEFPVYKDKTQAKIYSVKGDELLWTKKGFTDKGLEYAEPAYRRIRESKANVILALGQTATSLCLGDSRPIGKWRGSIIRGCEATGFKKVIPTFHPAATLHGVYTWRYIIMRDMRKADSERGYPELRLPQRDLRIATQLDEVLDFIEEAKRRKILATDIEIRNDHVSCFSMSYDPSVALTVPLSDRNYNNYWSLSVEMEIWSAYASIMSDPDVIKVNHNILGFDSPFLLGANNIFTIGELGDTMISQHIMYPNFLKGLDFVASIHTREPYWKDDGKVWENPDIDDETFWTYCGKDSAVALEAWLFQLKDELTEGNYWPTYRMTESLAKPLAYMTVRGFKVDREGLKKTQVDLEAAILAKEAELRAVAEWDFSPMSPKQCNKYFYETKGIKPYVNEQTRKPTTDDKAMSRIYRRYHLPEAKLVQEIRALRKLKGTYVDVELDEDGRLRCSWNPRGTWTGRLSSSQTIQGRGMNLQNLHPEFKSFIIADEDPA